MPFERPHIAQIKARIEADVDGRLIAGDPRLRRDLIRILGQMEAGVAHGLYGNLEWLAKNLLPNTKDPDILKIWADHYGVPRLGATRAEGPVGIIGTAGFTLLAGEVVQSADGKQYELLEEVTGLGPYAEGTVRALEGGADGNLADGETLTLLDPQPGIQSELVVVAPGLSGGADIETINAWSERLVDRVQNPPQGGSASDYRRWARDAHPAVTHAWTAPTTPGPGQVTVYIMTYGNTEDGLPSATVLDAVEAYIAERAPVTANFFINAPGTKVVPITVLLNPNTTEVQNAVRSEIEDLFQREAEPGGAIPLSHLNEAISLAPGEYDHTVDVDQADLTPGAGEILILGDLTWGGL